jgi:transposase InsO family protein
MSDTHDERLDEVALFRYGLIADLLHTRPGWRGLGKRLQEKAELSYAIPGSRRSRVAAETLRHWLKAYRRRGFDGLKPKRRRDAGSSHALPKHVADALCQLKEDKPELSVQLLIQEVIAQGHVPEGLPLPPSTVHRLLSRAGLMKKKSATEAQDHRRFSFEHAGELWMSDVMHGPAVVVSGNSKRKTYLLGLIDDATRVVPYAAFALAENTSAFLPVLEQAILRRGVPKRLYVDNGAAYRSHHLQLVCAKLGVTLIHARPYHPEGKGKQERWFRTVRLQLLTRLLAADLSSLEALNRRLWAYVEGEYHRAPHRGLDGLTPLDAWAARAGEVRHAGDPAALAELFLFEEKRKVAKDRTVSLHGVVYEVDATLVGATVTLRYSPARPKAAVQVWLEGKRAPDARVLDPHVNCFVRRARPKAEEPSDVPTSALRLSELRDANEKEGR